MNEIAYIQPNVSPFPIVLSYPTLDRYTITGYVSNLSPKRCLNPFLPPRLSLFRSGSSSSLIDDHRYPPAIPLCISSLIDRCFFHPNLLFTSLYGPALISLWRLARVLPFRSSGRDLPFSHHNHHNHTPNRARVLCILARGSAATPSSPSRLLPCSHPRRF